MTGLEQGMTNPDPATGGSLPKPIPSVGRIVLYRLTEQDAAAVNKRRQDAMNFGARDNQTGYVVHVGNGVSAGEEFPLVIVRVWSTDGPQLINGQVLLDGTDTLWVTSAEFGTEERQWHWPERV